MILFVGTEGVGGYVPEVTGEQVKFTGSHNHINEIGELLLEQEYSHIIIDLKQFIDPAEKIATELARMQKVIDEPFIFYALGKSQKSDIVNELLKRDFVLFVTSSVPGIANQELRTALNGYATITPPTVAPTMEELVKAVEQPKKDDNIKSVGVVGCCSRIGTTTQALQVVKYLISKGKKACYIAMDGSDITEWANIFGVERSKDDLNLDRVRIKGVDMYNDPKKLALIKSMDYDYLVFDFGDIHRETFSMIQFIERDIRIAVSGVKPVEMNGMKAIYEPPLADATMYLFSFVSDDTKRSILKLQGPMAEKTFFAPYSPDPFVFTSKSGSVLGDLFDAAKIKDKKKKKKGLFG